MPRVGRVVLPNYPHHIVQRGHNQSIVFVSDSDYRYYLANLARFKTKFYVKVYAYCLMTNHVHLLLAPGNEKSLGQLMKRLAGRQTRYRNKREGRRGTLWEGRYKSSPVDSNRYLRACVRYIELNPVRANMVATAEEFPWSSCHDRVKRRDHFLDPIPGLEWVLAEPERYRQFVADAVPDAQLHLIRGAIHSGHLTGDTAFVDQVDQVFGRRIEQRKRGRPRKNKSVPDLLPASLP